VLLRAKVLEMNLKSLEVDNAEEHRLLRGTLCGSSKLMTFHFHVLKAKATKSRPHSRLSGSGPCVFSSVSAAPPPLRPKPPPHPPLPRRTPPLPSAPAVKGAGCAGGGAEQRRGRGVVL